MLGFVCHGIVFGCKALPTATGSPHGTLSGQCFTGRRPTRATFFDAMFELVFDMWRRCQERTFFRGNVEILTIHLLIYFDIVTIILLDAKLQLETRDLDL